MNPRKEAAILATALGLAVCYGSIETQKPLNPSRLMETSTPSFTLEPIPTIETQKSIMDKASQSFLGILKEMQNYPNKIISIIPDRLYYLQQKQLGTVSISTPKFDIEGRLIPNYEVPLTCGFNNQGIFETIIDSNTYYFDSLLPFPIPITAAYLDRCLDYHDYIQTKYRIFQQSSPNISLTDALNQNPQWEDEAIYFASYLTTRDILIPEENNIPKYYDIYHKMMDIYKKCDGDQDCWNKGFFKYFYQNPFLKEEIA